MEEIIPKDLNPPKLLTDLNEDGEEYFQNPELYWNDLEG